MSAWTDRFNRLTGKTRFVVSRIFVALTGNESTTLLGVLNRAAQIAIDTDGDLEIMGESLVEICESLLQRETSWESSHNEGEVFWSEEDASGYLNELFTDSSRRYFSEMDETADGDQPLSIPMTSNVVVMLTLAIEGEVPDLETDLSNIQALRQALSAICNLQAQRRLRAIQVNFSPDQMGVVLTSDHLMQQFPELIPL
jgi:Protein of unknown function (DUF1517)